MNPNKHSIPSLFGIPSLLVVFAALCLTTFVVLTISTANAEKRISDVSADAVSAYYQADALAESVFADIRAGNIPDDVTVDGNCYAFSCPISDILSLEVMLYHSGDTWTILQWQAVASHK